MARSVYDLVEEKYGAPVDWREDPEGIGDADATAKTLARNNPRRVALLVVNLHATQHVFVRPGGAAAATTAGIRIDAGGGFWGINIIDDDVLPTFTWSIIGSGANTTIYTLHGVISGADA